MRERVLGLAGNFGSTGDVFGSNIGRVNDNFPDIDRLVGADSGNHVAVRRGKLAVADVAHRRGHVEDIHDDYEGGLRRLLASGQAELIDAVIRHGKVAVIKLRRPPGGAFRHLFDNRHALGLVHQEGERFPGLAFRHRVKLRRGPDRVGHGVDADILALSVRFVARVPVRVAEFHLQIAVSIAIRELHLNHAHVGQPVAPGLSRIR